MAVGENEAVLEAFVDFEREISVVAARGANGDFVHYGAIENQHRNGILDISIAPGRVSEKISGTKRSTSRAPFSSNWTWSACCASNFSFGKDGRLLINELAPRPHNSGHLTFDACVTSQFEQQLRAVCGLPFGDRHATRARRHGESAGRSLGQPRTRLGRRRLDS